MQKNTYFIAFEPGVKMFAKRLKSLLRRETGLHLLKYSSPQSMLNLIFKDEKRCFQLRFVLIAQSREQALGRLSWMDGKGKDHICCYVNADFQCVERQQNGRWHLCYKSAEESCLNGFSKLIKNEARVATDFT